jgi:phage N-6-adenine-methyltransferase
MTTGASFARGSSRQDFETPAEFMAAFTRYFGAAPDWDLAASVTNTKAPRFFTEEQDSLAQDWNALRGILWCNPPFANIRPWARKAAESESFRSRIYLLTPASIGANWYVEHVIPYARVYVLVGRLSFDGRGPFPKDCTLAVYGERPGLEVWRWKKA